MTCIGDPLVSERKKEAMIEGIMSGNYSMSEKMVNGNIQII